MLKPTTVIEMALPSIILEGRTSGTHFNSLINAPEI